MANPQKDEVLLVAGGNSYVLHFSLNSIIEAETAAGADINTVLGRLNSDPPDFSTMRLLLWALLIDHQPEMTQKEASKLMPVGGFPALSKTLQQAISLAMPSGEGEGENPQPASLDGTGKGP